jgi:hypothetical protein
MTRSSVNIKSEILNYYYDVVYKQYLFEGALQCRGIRFFEGALEKYWNIPLDTIDNVLEIGSGEGEHLPFVKHSPRRSYVCLDIRRVKKEQILESLSLPLAGVVKFVQFLIKKDINKIDDETKNSLENTMDDFIDDLGQPTGGQFKSPRVKK